MTNERNIWYQAGYALERARALGDRRDGEPGESGPPPAPVRGQRSTEPVGREDEGDALSPLADKLLALAAVAGGGALVAAALRVWRPRYKPGPLSLTRAAAAGAGAAVARMAFRALLGAPAVPRDTDPLAPVLAGAARGLLYASVVEPRLIGPVVLRGATYGAVEYLAEPWGGLEGLLDHLPVHRRVPFLAELLDARDDDPTLAGQLLFGVVLASLYGEAG